MIIFTLVSCSLAHGIIPKSTVNYTCGRKKVVGYFIKVHNRTVFDFDSFNVYWKVVRFEILRLKKSFPSAPTIYI